MAIIIPSRKIYGMENSKIPKNVISAIDVMQNDVSLIEDKEHSQKLTYELDLTKGTSGIRVDSSFIKIDASPQIPTPNLIGTWEFNETVDLSAVTDPVNINVPFKSNGKTFDGIIANSTGVVYYSHDELITVFGADGNCKNYAYRKVAFERAKETIKSYYYWFTQNAKLKFMIMRGGEVRSTDKTYSFDINRDREGYYITEINPRVEVKFDVEISKIKADADWAESPLQNRITFYPDNKIVQSSTISNNYTFDRTYRVNNYKKSLLYETNISILPSYINIDFSSIFEQKNDDLSLSEESSIISSFSWNSQTLQTNINPFYPYKIELITSEDKYDVLVHFVDSLTVMVSQCSKDSGYVDQGTREDALMIKMVAREAKVVFDETVRYLVNKNVNNRYGASNTEEIFSIGRNSLIRPQTAYGSENATEKFANLILDLYGSGRETAKILCSIGDYYDEDAKVQITTKPSQNPSHRMLFDIGDSVIPMVLDKDGNDVPMSIIDVSIGNDIPKVFRVEGVRVFYDGAVWQELTLRD